MAKNFLTPIGLVSLPSDPANGVEGQVYFNTTIDAIKIYVNGAWQELQGGGGSGSAFLNIQTSPATETIVADSTGDTLTLIAGENISITAASASDSITINSTGNYTNVDSIQYPDYIAFDTTPESTSASVGTIAWDSGDSTLSIQLDGQVNVGLGQEIIILANNGEATTLNKGEVVKLSGAQGQRPQVTRAYNLNDTGSALTIGIVAENITAGGEGFVVTQGIIKNINTNAFNEGDILYLSASAGVLSTVKPQAPNHYVFVGVVLKKNAVSGRIYVKPQNGYELDELHDVRITSVADGDIVIWNSASSLWLNSPKQNIINTASVAAYGSASAYTDSQINALTTSDIEEGSNLYYTNTRGLTTASTALVHGNHTNITASYNSASNQIILVGTGGGGAGGDGASVIYSTEQPDTSQLSIGDIWVDSNASVGYSGSSAPYVNQLTFWLEDNYGNLLPDADNIYSVGSSAFRVKDLYLGPNSLYIKSPNSNTNIPITIDSNNDVRFNESKLITLNNAESLLQYASQAYARSASANAFNSASAYTSTQLASIDLSSTIQTASAAAVNYLIDGAPAALNTLNELAEALNDNADILDLYLTQSSASTQYEKVIPYSTSEPSTPNTGDMWVDSNSQPPALKVYNGSAWVQLGAAVDDSQAIIAGRMFA
jgi:hypothetical protein